MRRVLGVVLGVCALLPAACQKSAPRPEGALVGAKTQPTSRPVVRAWTMRPLPKGEANFILMGDWDEASKRQKDVAQALARYVKESGIQFNGCIGTGDNLFSKPKLGLEDWMWNAVFEDMYDASIINFPFYQALGNHDFDKNQWDLELEYAKKNPHSRWKQPARWYRTDLPEGEPLISIFTLDSNRTKLSKEQWAQQKKWLDAELSKPRAARWTLIAAHNPLFSNGNHGDDGMMQRELGPIIKKHKVDFYVSGHEHSLQHFQIPGWETSFIISGGGGRVKNPMRRDDRGPFSRSLFGFAHLHLTAERATLRFFNSADGKEIHHFTRNAQGQVQVVATTGKDKAEPVAASGKLKVKIYQPEAYPADQVNLIAMGNWGVNTERQKLVAQMLSTYLSELPVQFNGTLSLGDNFYSSLKDIRDFNWQRLFEDMYDVAQVNAPWYAVLGEHDHEGNKAQVELDYSQKNFHSRWTMPGLWYRLDLPQDKPLVTVLMLDSNRPALSAEEWGAQRSWLEQELARPRQSKWVVCAAHHPLFSNGTHGDVAVLQAEWGALFKKYKVDFYLSSHDHNLQHLQIEGWPTSLLVLGGGGQKAASFLKDKRGPFARSLNGFAHLQFFDDKAVVRLIDGEDAEVVHTFERRDGQIRVLQTTPSDKADPAAKPQAAFAIKAPTTRKSSTTKPAAATRPATNR